MEQHMEQVCAPIPNAEVFMLDEARFEHYWPNITESLEAQPDLWNKWYTVESIRDRIMNNHMQAWVVCEKDGPIRAVFLTQILICEVGNILQLFWLRGNLPEGALKCISVALDRFGFHNGCCRLTLFGRRGWERRLAGLGAKFEGITLSRPIHQPTRN